MTKSKASILVHNTKWIYLSKIAAQVLGLISAVLVIRQLDVDIFGTYSLLISSFFLFSVFSLSAIDQVFLRYIPELIANKEYQKFLKFIKYGFSLSLLAFGILFFLLYINKEHFANFFNIECFEEHLLAFFFFCVSFYFKDIISITLQALLLHKKYAIINILNNIIRTVLYLVLLQKLDVTLLLYIEFFLAMVFVFPGLYFYYNYTKKLNLQEQPVSRTPVTAKRIIRYGLFSMGNVLGQGIVGRQTDHFIVAALSNPYYVGLYAFANRLYNMVYQILPFKEFYSVIRPLFFQKFSQEYNINDFQRMCAFMIKALIPVYTFPTLFFLFFGTHIINVVFDPRYIDSYWAIVILLSTTPFHAVFNTVMLTASLKERVDYEMYSKSVVVISILGAIIGMKTYGIIGVAAATTLGLFLKNLLLWYLMRNYKEVRFYFKDYSRYFFVVFAVTPFSLLFFISLNWLWLVIVSIVFVTYYLLSVIVFHPMTPYDFKILEKISSSSNILMSAKKFVNYIAKNRFLKNAIMKP